MNKDSFTEEMYVKHHGSNRAVGFSILKDQRGNLFKHIIGKNKKVLDLGCRDGALTSFIVEGNQVTGVDIDSVALERAKMNLGIKTLGVDLHRDWSELNGEKFEAIMAGEVLEHLFYPSKIMEKAAKHLVSEGIFLGSVPNAFSFKNRIRYLFGRKIHTPLSDPTHINHFSAKELKLTLEKYFAKVSILGLGRYEWLSSHFPSLIAFDLVFVAEKPIFAHNTSYL